VVVGCQAFGVVFVGFDGWEVVAGRYDDLVLGGFVAGELVVDGGESAEEQAGGAPLRYAMGLGLNDLARISCTRLS
jgi:hypothetical protein